MDSADDNEDDNAVGDGLGDEDGEPNNEDEGDDKLDCREEGVDEAETQNANPPHQLLPNWLLEPFKARVAESSSHDAKGLPPLYNTIKPFGFHGPQPSFSCASNQHHKNFSVLNFFSGILMLYAPKESHVLTARPYYNGTKQQVISCPC